MSTARYIIFGVFVYMAFILVTLPADAVYGYWKKYLGGDVPLYLDDIQGSIWSGQAAHAAVVDQQVQQVKWHTRPTALLLGKAELGFEFSIEEGYAKGVVGKNLLGDPYMSGVEAWLPMNDFLTLFNLQSLNAGGALAVNLDNVTIRDNLISSASGDITWQDAEINILKPMPLGSINVTLEPTDEGVKGVLSDQGGPLQADGLLTLTADGKYDFNAEVSVRDPQQRDLANALHTLGPTNSSGKTQLKLSGDLKNLRLL
jgi:hypothetical protein